MKFVKQLLKPTGFILLLSEETVFSNKTYEKIDLVPIMSKCDGHIKLLRLLQVENEDDVTNVVCIDDHPNYGYNLFVTNSFITEMHDIATAFAKNIVAC